MLTTSCSCPSSVRSQFAQWRPESKFESWMFGVMRNAWIDEVRSRGRRNRLFVDAEEGEKVGDDAGEAQIRLLAVQRALSSLPEEQRLAVALVLIEGLSYKEAADVLEIPIGTLTSRPREDAKPADALPEMRDW